MNLCCAYCRFFRDHEGKLLDTDLLLAPLTFNAWCHRHSLTAADGWPRTLGSQWCGDFEVRATPPSESYDNRQDRR